METRRLDYFVRIVDFGSITKAAAQIGIAQPALSQQLAILENEFRTKLLHRTSTGVEPTESGSDLYQHARIILRQLEQAREGVKTASGTAAGPAAVGLPTSTAQLLSLPLLETMRSRYPDIQLRVTEGLSGHLTELLMNARLDVSLLFQPTPVAGMHVEPLWVEDLLFIGPAGARLRNGISLKRTASHPLVMPAKGHGARTVLDAALAREALQPRYVAEVDSTATIKRAVQQGLGYSFLPWAAVHEELTAGSLTAVRVDSPAMVRTVSLCTLSVLPLTKPMECVQRLLRELTAGLLRSRSILGIRAPGE
jgi:LysR family nitrogen assimilation transcriptional regulator